MTNRTDDDHKEALRAAWDALEKAQDDFYGVALQAKELAAKADRAQDKAAAAAAAVAEMLGLA